MRRVSTIGLLLAFGLAVACGDSAEDPSRTSPTRETAPPSLGAGSSAVPVGSAGMRAEIGASAGVPGGSAGTISTPRAMAGAVAPPPPPPPAAGAPAPPVGGAPPATGAAGAAPPRSIAMRSAGCGKPAMMTGQFQAMIRAADLDRGYYMSVPKNYDPQRAYRLVFGYHGSNYTGKMMRQYLDNEKAPLLDGTLFVYPDGLPLPNEPDNVAWVLTANGRDLAFHDALFQFLRDNYCLDETRVFVNGQSFGALMTNFVGCQRGDVIRAIAAVAGSGPYGGMCQGKVAVWLTHGMDDMNVPFKSGEASRDFWVKANGCSQMTVPGNPMQCLVYQGCDPENGVTWCPHVNDGGHQEPSFGRAAVREFFAQF